MTGRLLAGSLLTACITSAVPAQTQAPLELRAWEFRYLLAQTQAKGDGPKLPDAATFDKLVVDSLRDVHNRGADLYNTSKEFDATYRMYQGGLLAVRPLLGHRPAAQKLIDDGLAAAEKEANVAQRAFKLHETIEAVRTHLREASAAPKPVDPVKKPEDKPKDPPKKPEDKVKPKDPVEVAPNPKEKTSPKPVDPGTKPTKPVNPPAKAGSASGRVTLKGQPLAGGEITFVSVDQTQPRVLTATVQADGTYSFDEPVPAGKYVATVVGKGVPEKFQTTTTSGIAIEVKASGGEYNIDLK